MLLTLKRKDRFSVTFNHYFTFLSLSVKMFNDWRYVKSKAFHSKVSLAWFEFF